MKKREAETFLTELCKYFPVIAIVGPRQAGKTTLAKSFFKNKPYISLENPDTLWQFESDPRSFLERYPKGVIIDEAQRCPDLFSYLQQVVDDDPSMGKYVLTGSQQFSLKSHISQSLAGRVGYLNLLPFTLKEWFTTQKSTQKLKTDHLALDEVMYRGLYPPVLDREIPSKIWFPQYVATYVERDVREILEIKDLSAFSKFVRMCAARVGQLLNLSSLAADCGITHNTAKSWIDVLEASFLVKRLLPWHENFGKRLIKTPKLYMVDTGLLCWLLGVENAEHLSIHSQRGSIFENWVIMEEFKKYRNVGEEPHLYFWRDQAGHEVDLIRVKGEQFYTTEIKSGKTVAKDWFKGLNYFSTLAKSRVQNQRLIYGGKESFVQNDVEIVSWMNR